MMNIIISEVLTNSEERKYMIVINARRICAERDDGRMTDKSSREYCDQEMAYCRLNVMVPRKSTGRRDDEEEYPIRRFSIKIVYSMRTLSTSHVCMPRNNNVKVCNTHLCK